MYEYCWIRVKNGLRRVVAKTHGVRGEERSLQGRCKNAGRGKTKRCSPPILVLINDPHSRYSVRTGYNWVRTGYRGHPNGKRLMHHKSQITNTRNTGTRGHGEIIHKPAHFEFCTGFCTDGPRASILVEFSHFVQNYVGVQVPAAAYEARGKEQNRYTRPTTNRVNGLRCNWRESVALSFVLCVCNLPPATQSKLPSPPTSS